MRDGGRRRRRGARAWRGPLVVAVLAVVAVVAVAVSAPQFDDFGFGGGDEEAQTPPFDTFAAVKATADGEPAGIALVGDSLVAWAPGGPDAVAEQIRTATGVTTAVDAAAGASWVTYGRPGEQNGNALAADLADAQDARLTIIALATNDARLLAEHPRSYAPPQQRALMDDTVSRTRIHSGCVLLVNLHPRPDVDYLDEDARLLNAEMADVAAGFAGGGVTVADWDAHSAGHDDWFVPGDAHLTEAGSRAYIDFITAEAARLVSAGGCTPLPEE